ncbi:MAG: helix-turn-helix transcriptional regulator [Spirochaetota bacterium]
MKGSKSTKVIQDKETLLKAVKKAIIADHSNGTTYTEIAGKIGCTKQFVNYIANGMRQPSLEVLMHIATQYNIGYLFQNKVKK